MEDQISRTIEDSITVMKDSGSKDLAEIRSILRELAGNLATSKPRSIEFQRFCGENPEKWIYQAERYFDFYEIAENHKLSLASSYLDGAALTWYHWLFQNKQLADWEHFTAKVLIRFRERHIKSPEGCLANRWQVSSVTEYPCRFEAVSLGSSEADMLSPCLAHVHPQWSDITDSTLLQNNDEQSECETKTAACKMFDDFTVAPSNASIEMPDKDAINPDSSGVQLFGESPQRDMLESGNEILHDKHSTDAGNSAQEISVLTLLPLTSIESLFEDGKFKERSKAKTQVESSKSLVPQKLVSTTNIEEELVPEEFSPIFRGLFTIFKSDAHFHVMRPHNKIELLGTIPLCSCVDNWFDTGQDFEVESCVLLSVESEELTQVSHEESWLIPFYGCEYIQLYDEKFTMANEVSSDPKKFVPEEVFLIESENPAWAAEFASIIKQPQLHNFHLVVLSRIVLNFQRAIVEVARFLRCLSGQPSVSLMPKAVEHENTKAEFVGSDFPFDPGTNFLTTCLGFSQNCVVFEVLGSLKLASNATLCKFLLKVCDKTILEESDMVMIEMGFHIDGLIVVVDHMHVIQEEPTIGRAVDVIVPANEATEVIPRLVRPGRETTNVPKVIQKVVDVYDYKIGESVACVQLKQFLVVGNKVILSVSNPAIRVDKYIKQETLASGVVNKLIEALNPIAILAPRIIDFPIKEYPIPLSKTLGYTAQVDLSMELTIVGDVFYMEANSGAVTRMGQNDTFVTEFSRDTAVYVPWLNTNLEDKVLFEGRSIVVNQADFVRAYGLDVVNGADSVDIIGPTKMLESFIWDPGPITNWLNRNWG